MTDWKTQFEVERAIVDSVWKALGIDSFDAARGKTISEIVAEQRAALQLVLKDNERYVSIRMHESTVAVVRAALGAC